MIENPQDDEVNFMMECANAGYCNRDTGMCECFPGYVFTF